MTLDTAGPGSQADLAQAARALPASQAEAALLSEAHWVTIVSELAAQLGAWDNDQLANQAMADDGSVVMDSALGLCVASYVTACFGREFGDLSKIPPAKWRSARGIAGIIQESIGEEGE